MTKAVKKPELKEKQAATARRRAVKAYNRHLAKQIKLNRKLESSCSC